MVAKFLRGLNRILPHIVLVLALLFMVFLVLNSFNPMMGFLTGTYSRVLLWVFSICAYLESAILIFISRRKK